MVMMLYEKLHIIQYVRCSKVTYRLKCKLKTCFYCVMSDNKTNRMLQQLAHLDLEGVNLITLRKVTLDNMRCMILYHFKKKSYTRSCGCAWFPKKVRERNRNKIWSYFQFFDPNGKKKEKEGFASSILQPREKWE